MRIGSMQTSRRSNAGNLLLFGYCQSLHQSRPEEDIGEACDIVSLTDIREGLQFTLGAGLNPSASAMLTLLR